MASRPDGGEDQERREEAPDDVEGHSLSLVMGLDAMSRGRDGGDRQRKPADEDLPPISKPFPRMKDDLRK
jgi:hypothetical protein